MPKTRNQFNTLRQRVSRLVRDTLAFSKKLANHIGAIKFFIWNWLRVLQIGLSSCSIEENLMQ